MQINPSTLSALQTTGKRYLITDELHPGFCVRVCPKGNKELIYRYKEDNSTHEKRLGDDYLQAFTYYLALHNERTNRRGAGSSNQRQSSLILPTDSIFLDGTDLPTLFRGFMRDHVLVNLSRRTEGNYLLHLDRTLKATKGGKLYRGLTNLQESRLELKQVLRDVRDFAPIQCNRMRTCLSSCFGWGVEQDLVSDNPVFKMPSAPERPRHRLLKDEELREVFKVFRSSNFSINTVDGLLLVLMTGMRAGELLSIRPSFIDFESARLMLPTSKNGHPHLVALSSLAVKLLRKHVALVRGDDKVFTTSTYGLSQVARRAAQKADVTIATTHDYRRTCATMAGSLGVRVETISRLLNHSASGVTRKHYALYDGEKEKRDALELIANKLTQLGMEV